MHSKCAMAAAKPLSLTKAVAKQGGNAQNESGHRHYEIWVKWSLTMLGHIKIRTPAVQNLTTLDVKHIFQLANKTIA